MLASTFCTAGFFCLHPRRGFRRNIRIHAKIRHLYPYFSFRPPIIAAMNLILTENGHQLRRTKIIATLGPATDDREVLKGIIRAGADVFRLNMSHGSVEEQKARARMVREVSSGLGREVALLADLQGPKIRVERFENGSVELSAGDEFTLDAEDAATPGDSKRVGVSYPGLVNDVKSGDLLLLDDGMISMQVKFVNAGQIVCEVENGGTLKDRKGLNLQGGGLSLSGIAEHDLPHITAAAEVDVDYLAVIENPIPTRAEVRDVANAVIDGTDAVMLSAETAVGKHPVKVIEAMNRICLGAERHSDREGDITQLNVRFQRIDQEGGYDHQTELDLYQSAS
jgi:pyruvate kinase